LEEEIMRKRNRLQLFAAALGLAASTLAAAEVGELKMMSQYGIGYMQLTVMKHDKLVEKHLAAAGLPNTKVSWTKLGAGAVANDALLSGTLHLAAGGTGPAIILWDKTKGGKGDVHGVAALSSMPNLLISRNPNVKTIRDFTDKDRIAMAGAGSSVQTTYLQIATAKAFGKENYKKLNHLMVNLPHPEGLNSLLSGGGDITAQFTSPPFYQRALEDKAIHKVLDSYEIMGGPNTFLMVWATSKFRDENPKSYKAILAALKEATDAINADRRRAAEIYSKEGGGKESVDKLLKIMQDPQIRFTVAPEGILPFAQFMHDVERIRNRPNTWKDLFFNDIHNLQGS
jgi:NitT/TauT family transport system substrate-binding protein